VTIEVLILMLMAVSGVVEVDHGVRCILKGGGAAALGSFRRAGLDCRGGVYPSVEQDRSLY